MKRHVIHNDVDTPPCEGILSIVMRPRRAAPVVAEAPFPLEVGDG
jgi:hypothetical protein